MPFTSASVNKNNRFCLRRGKTKLFACIEETALYTITQKVPLLVPVYELTQKNCHGPLSRQPPNRIACLDLARVLAACTKTSKNSMVAPLAAKPRKIIFCRITGLDLRKKLVPLPGRKTAVAMLTYRYKLALTYMDENGKVRIACFNSGPRRQRATLNTAAGQLDVQMRLKCLVAKILPAPPLKTAGSHFSKQQPHFKPVRFTLKARSSKS